MVPVPPAADATDEGHRLLADLSAAQRRAVTTEAAPLCVLAAAGAGKTRVLTRRVAYRAHTGSAAPGHTLVLTFTRKAAGELRDRLQGVGVRDHAAAGTFHAIAAAQLRRWWADRGRTAPVLLHRRLRLLGPLAAARPATAGVPVSELAGHIEWAKARDVVPDQFEAVTTPTGRRLPVPAAELAALYQRYEHEKRRRGVVDFDDLLAAMADALESDPELAAAQRWRWRHIYVDEFQDVNPLQHRLLRGWLGDGADLCVVGDPNQAIYGWNGADPTLLDHFGDHWPGATVVRLDDNHRCSPEIVAAADAVIGGGGRLRSARPPGPAPIVRPFPSEAGEAAAVALGLRDAHERGIPWSRMAVLVRTNAQVPVIIGSLQCAGVPFRAPGAGAVVDHPTVKAALDALGRDGARAAQVAAVDLEQAAAQAVEAAGPADDGGRAAALTAVARLSRTYVELEPTGRVDGLLAWLPTAGGLEPVGAATVDSVTVCSFHRAKGLEWTAVWLCGLEQGLVPIGHATTADAEAEERRLLYVAMTRAERELRCSWSQTRTFGARAVVREPSPWLAAIPGVPPIEDELRIDAEAWRARLAEQRRRLREGAPRHRQGSRAGDGRSGGSRSGGSRLAVADGATVASLTSWRAGVARGSGVPAHVILHDRSLEALASLHPTTIDELLAVPGLGPVKVARYGTTLLSLVAARSAIA